MIRLSGIIEGTVFNSSTANRVHTYGAVYQKVARECEPYFNAIIFLRYYLKNLLRRLMAASNSLGLMW